MAKPKELVQKARQTTIDGLPVASSSQDSVRKTHKKPETKALHNTDDSDYIQPVETLYPYPCGYSVYGYGYRYSEIYPGVTHAVP